MFTALTQPTKNSCQSTCFAMLYGADDEMLSLFVEKIHPHYFDRFTPTHQILEMLDLPHRRCYTDEMTLRESAIYLLTVPSLNLEKWLHAVIRSHSKDNKRVYDPAKGFANRRYYTNELNVARVLQQELINLDLDIPISPEESTSLAQPLGGFVPEIEFEVADILAWREKYPKEEMIKLLHRVF